MNKKVETNYKWVNTRQEEGPIYWLKGCLIIVIWSIVLLLFNFML